ncbi:MAG: hypothetical protein OEV36_02345, partial [Myxococcales bacterium]|nr:hypothetical protein [Myxococcales bacterium]
RVAHCRRRLTYTTRGGRAGEQRLDEHPPLPGASADEGTTERSIRSIARGPADAGRALRETVTFSPFRDKGAQIDRGFRQKRDPSSLAAIPARRLGRPTMGRGTGGWCETRAAPPMSGDQDPEQILTKAIKQQPTSGTLH